MPIIPKDVKTRIESSERSFCLPNYFTYAGKNRHCHKGRCILGSSPFRLILTIFLINLTVILLIGALEKVRNYYFNNL